jgi:peptidoglycan/xylan/chitin deacetylase (PgdA/CDA1 family)
MPPEPPTPPFILMYHSVAPRPYDPFEITVSPGRFVRQVSWLRRRGLRGVCMRELLAAAECGRSAGLVGLTFDDGYADFTTYAMPVLRRHGFTATVFVVAGRLAGHNDWDQEGPLKPLLSVDQIRTAAECGMEIGSHGLTHQSLSSVDAGTLATELKVSKEILDGLGIPAIHGLAYPYGEVTDQVAGAVSTFGYDYAVATWHSGPTDRYTLPRTYVGERDSGPRLAAKVLRHRLTWGGRR